MIRSIQSLTREVRWLCYAVMIATLVNIAIIACIYTYVRTHLELENTQAELIQAQGVALTEFMDSFRVSTGNNKSKTSEAVKNNP